MLEAGRPARWKRERRQVSSSSSSSVVQGQMGTNFGHLEGRAEFFLLFKTRKGRKKKKENLFILFLSFTSVFETLLPPLLLLLLLRLSSSKSDRMWTACRQQGWRTVDRWWTECQQRGWRTIGTVGTNEMKPIGKRRKARKKERDIYLFIYLFTYLCSLGLTKHPFGNPPLISHLWINPLGNPINNWLPDKPWLSCQVKTCVGWLLIFHNCWVGLFFLIKKNRGLD